MSGLICLKNLMQAYEFEIDQERKPLFQIAELFFPVLENLIQIVI